MRIVELNGFNNFYEKVKTQTLPIKTAYKLNKLSKLVGEEISFYQDKFQEILNTYGMKGEDGNFVPTDDGNGIKIVEGKEKECNEKLAELDALETDKIDITFDIDEFSSIELSPIELDVLMLFIKD